MEPGPAIFFTADQLTITPEPALPDGSDKIDIPNLDQVDGQLSGIATELETVRQELFGEAMSWQTIIDGPAGAIYGDLDTMSGSVPQDVLDNLDPTQTAIDGAESSFLRDAYQDNPPWYTPPPEANVPIEPTPPAKETA